MCVHSQVAMASATRRCVCVLSDSTSVVLTAKPSPKVFTFDCALGEHSTQDEMFTGVGKPITHACLMGYNGTIFCYGQTGVCIACVCACQCCDTAEPHPIVCMRAWVYVILPTGSGKTHTMFGPSLITGV